MASSSKNPVDRHGLKVWHAPPAPELDICFIHGLLGDRDETWTCAGKEAPWPEHFLSPVFENARLLTYGYSSNIVPSDTESIGALSTIADSFVRSLKEGRENTQHQDLPIIFVAHGLGGLIVKRAIHRSFSSNELRIKAMASCLLGVIFMGTPHAGSVLSNIFSPLVSGTSQLESTANQFLASLCRDGVTATDLNTDFVHVISSAANDANVFCFFETKPRKGANCLIVESAAAKLANYQS